MTSNQTPTELRARFPLRRILCADEQPAFLALALRTLGGHFPVQVVGWAKTGLQVLDLAQSLAPDLVLMDLHLPGINGLHATSWLKAFPHSPQVVLLSPFESLRLRKSARAAGADGFCDKTALTHSLAPLLAFLWPARFPLPARGTSAPPLRLAPTPSRRRPIRTLLVDDSLFLRQAVGSFLQRSGAFQLVGTAANGRLALAQVDALHPDLVLMDWRMPLMDGLEATRRIKTAPNPPVVIFMPLQDDPLLRAAAQAAGADGFVGKQELPSKLPVLLEAQFFGARRR